MKNVIIKLLLTYSKVKKNKGIPILEYHRVSNSIDQYDVHSIYPDEFYWQMKYLKDNNYKVISLDELHSYLKNNLIKHDNIVALTFDDGHKDNLYFAAPILREFGFKATMFLITDYVGKSGWLTPNGSISEVQRENYQRWNLLNWDDIISLSDCYWFESHCKSHKKLDRVSDEEIMDELESPQKIIFEKLDFHSRYFCYPYGLYSDKVIKLIKKTKYKGAVTIEKGTNEIGNTDAYKLRRNEVGRSITCNEFTMLLKDESFIYYKISKIFNSIKVFLT